MFMNRNIWTPQYLEELPISTSIRQRKQPIGVILIYIFFKPISDVNFSD